MANNQNTQSNQNDNTTVIEVKVPGLEKSAKTMARCAKVQTTITVGLTIVAAVAYAALGVTIKKILNQ